MNSISLTPIGNRKAYERLSQDSGATGTVSTGSDYKNSLRGHSYKSLCFIVSREEGGGFSAKAADHSIFTQGDTLEALEENIRDAIECHFDNPETFAELRLELSTRR